jgi:glutamate N-acetyltransferase/amino-acid N-acetyltransferase
MDRVESGIRQAAAKLGNTARHALAFADAILTTDLVRKSAAVRLHIGKQSVTIAGVCKGSGMIGPRLALPDGGPARHATMLAYLTTDANIAAPVLARLLADATEPSFNAVTVDDHASTNDTVCILASRFGAAVTNARARAAFGQALSEVCLSLAKQIAADGEGATKIVQVRVTAAASDADAKLIARTIANSPLVKCALHGNDPNWGRIVSAAGYCGARFDPDRCRLRLQGTPVFRGGQPVAFNTAAVSRSLKSAEVVIDLDCGIGKSAATIWTCDLSKEYVTINADYHT